MKFSPSNKTKIQKCLQKAIRKWCVPIRNAIVQKNANVLVLIRCVVVERKHRSMKAVALVATSASVDRCWISLQTRRLANHAAIVARKNAQVAVTMQTHRWLIKASRPIRTRTRTRTKWTKNKNLSKRKLKKWICTFFYTLQNLSLLQFYNLTIHHHRNHRYCCCSSASWVVSLQAVRLSQYRLHRHSTAR